MDFIIENDQSKIQTGKLQNLNDKILKEYRNYWWNISLS